MSCGSRWTATDDYTISEGMAKVLSTSMHVKFLSTFFKKFPFGFFIFLTA